MRTLIAFTLFWIPMMPIAILNGLARQMLIAPHVSELAAHQISTASALALFTLYTWLLIRRHPLASNAQAIAGGIVWLTLTVAFEFIFGHFVGGHSWQTLISDYNIIEGRVWILIPLALTVLPLAVHKINSFRTDYY